VAVATIRVAELDGGAVVISVDYDTVTLSLISLHWDNTSGSPYSVDWGNRHFTIPVGSGTVNIPGNRKLISLGLYPDDSTPILAFGDGVRVGRA